MAQDCTQPVRHSAAAPRRQRLPSGLEFSVARSLGDVVSAWELVYQSYRRRDLVEVNPFGIHTTTQAVGPQTIVVRGCIEDVTVCTVSAILDRGQGLPLDAVYRANLDELRSRGHRLMEIGLFADRREQLTRSLDALFQMMRYIFWIGLGTGHDFAVIGVNPRHVAFYTKYFDFDLFGQETVYPTVRNHPVVPLYLDWKARMTAEPLPKGLAFLRANPLPEGFMDQRFDFAPDTVARSVLGAFLNGQSKQFPGSEVLRAKSA